MTYTLAQGVQLHVLETKKYKTVRFFIRFTDQLKKETTTKRTLLSSLMETDTLQYSDQTQLSAKLADLYGASFGMNVSRKGNLHWVNLMLQLVNGKYVEDTQLMADAVNFLKEIIFYPNIQAGSWNKKTFDLEKENLKTYLESLKEDKQTYASLELQELYFDEDESQRMPSLGRVEDLEELTAEELSGYYQHMLQHDKVDIFVIGDVNQEEIIQLFQQLPFDSRSTSDLDIFYHQPIGETVKERKIEEPVVQAKLNLAYTTNIYYGQPERFALMVFNGLFGGFPHSRLFMNVREKESLAYYASSSIDTFRGYMSVQTGIEGKNRERVLQLVEQQLETLRTGEITAQELEQTKAMLKNQYILSLDNAQSAIETRYLDTWLPETQLSDEAWLAELEKVTTEDVRKVAQQVQLQAIFFLDGNGADYNE